MADTNYAFVARMYTGARKFPRVFGRFLDGRKVPGGPYKITQIVIGGSVLLLAVFSYTLHWWSTGSPIMDLIFGGAVVAGVFWGSGKIPQTKRNPVALVLSAWRAIAAPRTGRYRGVPFVAKKPHHTASTRRAGTITVAAAAVEPVAATTAPDVVAAPAPSPQPAIASAPAPISGVARLLAQATHD